MLPTFAPRTLEFVGGDQDASTQPHPATGSGQVLDLRVAVPCRHCFSGREHSEAAIGRCAQDWMHRPSLAVLGVVAD
jgi:hypothetical protein